MPLVVYRVYVADGREENGSWRPHRRTNVAFSAKHSRHRQRQRRQHLHAKSRRRFRWEPRWAPSVRPRAAFPAQSPRLRFCSTEIEIRGFHGEPAACRWSRPRAEIARAMAIAFLNRDEPTRIAASVAASAFASPRNTVPFFPAIRQFAPGSP